jgi:hypothetical protein
MFASSFLQATPTHDKKHFLSVGGVLAVAFFGCGLPARVTGIDAANGANTILSPIKC